MRDRKKGMVTVLEDKILSLNGFLLFLLMLLSAKKIMLKLFFLLHCLALVLSFVMDTKRG